MTTPTPVRIPSCSPPRRSVTSFGLFRYLPAMVTVSLFSGLLFCPATRGRQALRQVASNGSPSNSPAGDPETRAPKAANTPLSEAVISNVTVVQNTNHATVRVEGAGQFDSRPFSIPNPERLVLDFADARLATQKTSIASHLAPVRGVRLAQRTPNSVRLIVDLDSPVPFEINHDGGTLVIDFALKGYSLPSPAVSKGAHSIAASPPSTPSPKAPPQSKETSGQSPSTATTPDPKAATPQESSAKSAQGKQEPSVPAAPTQPTSAGATPTHQVMTPFGPVNSLRSQGSTNAQQQAQSQNPAPAPQPAVQPVIAQGPSNLQKSAQQPTPEQTPAAPAPTPSTQPTPQQPANSAATLPGVVQAPPVAPEDKQAMSVSLNLENVDLYQVIRIIGTELKINYMVDPAVKGSVTINTSGAISRADLFSVLESILQVNGAAIIKQDGYYRIVPANDAKSQPVPLVFAKSPEMLPAPGETFVLEVFPMRYVAASEMGKVLAPFISPAGQVIVNEKGNVLLVLETPPKLKQVADLLNVFDSSTFSRQRVRLYQVKQNSAKSMVKELQDVFSGYSFTGNSAIRFVAIDSLNAVLAISPDPEAFKEIEEWIHQLDQAPPQQAGEQNYVYAVQNAKASDLRDILLELYGGSVQKQQAPIGNLPLNPANPMVSPEAIAEAQRAQEPQNPERVQGRLHIMADNKNNALIIQASPHDYEIVKRTIVELDLLPRQVLIDAQIYSVDLTGDLSLGISYYLGQQSSLPGPVPLSTSGSFAGGQSPGSLLASTFAILSQTRALQMFLNATDQRSRVKVLSAPSILVTDNTSARIQVGSSVPVPIGSSLTPVQSNGSSVFAQTIQYEDTGVILTVTPHINSSGVVTLNLSQEVSSAVPNSTSQIVAPVINKSTFQTNVVLADGEPLALGGIISTTNSVSTDRIPVLGEIPYVGALFGTTTRKTERDEIVLIITPHVLQHLPQAAAQSKDFLDKMRELKKDMDSMN